MLFRLAFKNLVQRPIRYILTGIAVLVGVSSVVAVFTFAAGLVETFDRLSGDIESGFDAEVRSISALGPNVDAPPVEPELVEEIEALDFVQVVQPIVIGFGVVAIDDEGNEIFTQGGAPNIGSNWETELLEPRNFIVEGREPQADNEFVIDVDGFDAGVFEVGETYDVVSRGSVREFELVGTFNFGDEEQNRAVGAILIAFTDNAAFEFVNGSVGFDSIQVTGDGVDSDEELVRLISDAIDADDNRLEVLTREEKVEETQDGFGVITSIFSTVLIVFAFFILFVSIFVIYNVFSITLAQRIRELSLLRSIGSSGRQITNMMLGEAVVMGIVATLIGLPSGLGLAWLLRKGLAQANFPSDIPLELSAVTIIVAVFVGIFVTLVAASVPAIKARQITPIDGLSDNPEVEREFVSSFGLAASGIAISILSIGGMVIANNWLVYLGASAAAAIGFAVFLFKNTAFTKNYFGIGFFLFGVGLFVAGLVASLDVASTFALIGAGSVVGLIGASQASAALAEIVAKVVGSKVGAILLLLLGVALALFAPGIGYLLATNDVTVGLWIFGIVGILVLALAAYLVLRTAIAAFGISGKLGKLNAARNTQRTATTATALMIGVTLITTVGVIGESIRQSVNEALSSTFQADLFVGPETQDPSSAALSVDLIPQIGELEGVASAESWRGVGITNIHPVGDTDVQEQLLRLDDTEELISAAAEGGEVLFQLEEEFGVDIQGSGMTGVSAEILDSHVDLQFTVRDTEIENNEELEPVFITEDEAIEFGYEVGDSYFVIVGVTPVEFTVAGFFTEEFLLSGTPVILLRSWDIEVGDVTPFPNIDQFGSIVIDSDADFTLFDLRERLDEEAFEQFIVDNPRPELSLITTEVVKADVAAILDEQAPTNRVQTRVEIAQEASDQINQVLLVINMLLILAGFIALLSIAIALSLSVFERTREIGVMRSIGTTRPSLRRTIRWEGAIIAVFGALVGVALGLLIGVAAASKIPEELVSIVAIPWPAVIGLVILAMLAGLIAAVLPAWRAGRMNVLEAISHN